MSSGRRRVLVGLALGLAAGAVVVTIALHDGTRPVEARRVDQPPGSPPALSATHTTSVAVVGAPDQAPPVTSSSGPASAREPVPAEPVTSPVTATTGPTTGEPVLPPPSPQLPPVTSGTTGTSGAPTTSRPQNTPAPVLPLPPWFHSLLGLPWLDHCSLLRLEVSAGRYDQDEHDPRLLRICLG